jgi:hypothetical protein
VQVELPGVTTDIGAQVSALIAKGDDVMTVIVPPVPVIETGAPDVNAPKGLVTEIVVAPAAVDESVTLTLATTPFETILSLSPASKHVYEPGLPEHDIDFPADVAAGPAAADIATMSEEE